MTELSVNVNKVALLRNTRTIGIPSVTEAARAVIEAGAYGVTVHPRPDQRHIRPVDVDYLYEMLKEYSDVEFNIEGNPYHNLLDVVRKTPPTQCTLVPDDPAQFTSDHGWNMTENMERLKPIVKEMKDLGCRVSLFMDPDPGQIRLVPEVGADRIELYTEPYADAFGRGEDACADVLSSFVAAGEYAQNLGLAVNAGHDLNLDNVTTFCRAVPNVLEVSIGHALIADALVMGLEKTTKAYLEALTAAS
ncbi:MAG: pyridoxine 5'-phosphate synthase [Gemmatimonadota bacterium]|nr:pyridoxine 5'-phosphate synthase [Gemmatimonadota bacterium]